MILLWSIAVLICISTEAFLQIKYAYANYPQSWRWRFSLFLPAFLMGGIMGGGIAFNDAYPGLAWWSFLIFMGLAFGIIFAFVFPTNVRYAIPKRNDTDSE